MMMESTLVFVGLQDNGGRVKASVSSEFMQEMIYGLVAILHVLDGRKTAQRHLFINFAITLVREMQHININKLYHFILMLCIIMKC